MAKKRKFNSKSSETVATRQKKQQKQQQKKEEEEEEEEQQQHVNEEQPVEEEVEEEEIEEEEVEEDEDGDDDQENEEEEDEDEDEETKVNDGDEDDDEPIHNLLEPFTKELLISILIKAAENHPDVATQIKKFAEQDTVHRKIFVHGLGWDSTADSLREAFSQYGEIEDCKAVTDRITGKSKGYGFILFKTRAGARKALKEPQKKIGVRMTSCQLAALGPVPASTSSAPMVTQQPLSELTQRKIYVSNVSADLDAQKLYAFFAQYGEIEDGPLGLDKQTGKPRGFCLFVYRTVESARKALEEPHKKFEGHVLHCQRAIDGPKHGKPQQNQVRGQQFGRNGNPNLAGAIGGPPATGAGLMGQSVAGVPFNQAGSAAVAPGLNPALGQALTALLSQGAGLGLNNLLGTLGGGIGAPGVAGAGHGIQGGYGSQAVAGGGINPGGVLGGYGAQGGLQAAYPNQQMGQGGSGRTQQGYMGGAAPYTGH